MPATLVRLVGESGARPPSPRNGNQPGRGSLRCARTTRQIPAAPSPPAVRHEAGPMAEAIAPEGDLKEAGSWSRTIARAG